MAEGQESGFYCSTSGTTFADKDALADHYKSDLHRYNLKRKVAGLPPVTRDWFDARREQLASMQARSAVTADTVIICPLTNRRFQSQATYDNHTHTRRFRDAMKQAGLTEVPQPRLITKSAGGRQGGGGPAPGVASRQAASALLGQMKGMAMGDAAAAASDGDDGDETGWETDEEFEGSVPEGAEWSDMEGAPEAVPMPSAGASAAGGAAAALGGAHWEPWDVCRSLFDNHASSSFDKNLEYMYRKFGFYFPDAPFLKDPEGLLQYLGAKLQYGHVPLYTRGDDASSKQFHSLHAVQRHMVDSNRCGMCYDENEEEYEEFYEYPDEEGEEGALALADAGTAAAGAELVIARPGAPGSVQIIGNRGFKHLYRQKHRPAPRPSVAANQMLLSYRDFGVPGVSKAEVEARTQRLRHDRRRHRTEMKSQIANDKIYNLPKNVTY